MRRDNTPWRPLETADLDWTNPGAPQSTQFNDIYYSLAGGLDEGRHVFLAGNGLPLRWATHPHSNFCIAETGFGTGLNFLLTWAEWRAQTERRPQLHYVGIEKFPLALADLKKALANWPSLSDLSRQLLAQYPEPIPGQHRIMLENGHLTLDLWWEDVALALPDLARTGRRPVDAWYLDGFAPARNEAMWGEPLYRAMAGSSRDQASFATFTAAGDVRRGLQTAGFKVEKAAGFGRKRECLRGTASPHLAALETTDTPWDLCSRPARPPQSALVIGAGLAGCTAAAALARRGVAVTVMDQGALAGEGSGNNQGMLYTRLSARHSSLTDFALQSFQFAHRYYGSLLDQGMLTEGLDGSLCGSFHQSEREEEMISLAQSLASTPGLAQVLSAQDASQRLGLEQSRAGYWFPKSGWMRPASVCAALLNMPGIRILENTGTLDLQPIPGGWQASSGGQSLAQADCAVIAAGVNSNKLSNLAWLPLQAIRGQTTELPSSPLTSELQAGFCHTGYIAPAREGNHCIGATFDLEDDSSELRAADHSRNLQALAEAVPGWRDTLAKIDPAGLSGRVGFRCATPDYLPIAGAVPDREAFLQRYGQLRKNAKRIIPEQGDYMPGLYLSTGHGSRGLTSAPLVGEVLASEICGEAAPLSRELYRAIAPGRFIIRALARGRA